MLSAFMLGNELRCEKKVGQVMAKIIEKSPVNSVERKIAKST